MTTYTFIAHELNIVGGNINVIGSSTFTLDLFDDDSIMGEPGDTGELASLDGAPAVSYSFLGVGITDIPENMIVIDIGGTLYGFNRLGGNLENGNTKIALADLDDTPVVPCFTPGTMIATPDGLRAVETLQVGEMITTRDNGPQPIVAALKRQLSRADLLRKPDLYPIKIQAGALGDGLPNADLTVSPQHRMLIQGWRAELFFAEPEVFVAAKSLINDSTVTTSRAFTPVEYIHLVLDEHQIIYANGTLTESVLLSCEFMNSMTLPVQCELAELFPELHVGGMSAKAMACAPLLRHHEGRLLGEG